MDELPGRSLVSASRSKRGAAHVRVALTALGFSAATLTVARSAQAQAPESDMPSEGAASEARESRNEVPILAYSYAAAGVDGLTFGAQGYATMIAATHQTAAAGGGVTVYGSPLDGLTLLADLPRDPSDGHFKPSFAILGRPYGENAKGFALGLLAKYKVEGFALEDEEGGEGEGEFEHEMEGGVLVGYAEDGFHLDANAIAGVGLNEEAEVDVEGRLRVGYDLGPYVRLGVDGQVRGRVHGERTLPGGRTWDFAAGPQVVVSVSHFFGSFTAGPVTLGVSEGVGFSGMVTAGGTTL